MKKLTIILFLVGIGFITSCTEETRNRFFREADNLIGLDLKVSYIDSGKVVKTWVIRDSKITIYSN